MPGEPGADLGRWARDRAPQLIARAEAEAVTLLRDALVSAALAGRGDSARPNVSTRADPPRPEPDPVRTDQQGELVWVYCVFASGDPVPDIAHGVDSAFPVTRIDAGGLSALVSNVPRAEFGAEALRENLNQLPWLERVARSHEDVLEGVLEHATIVPLRLCTLYEDEDGVRRMIERERTMLTEAIVTLAGREEWAVKLLVDPGRLVAEVEAGDTQAQAMAAELAGQSEAAAYMLRRRLERHLRDAADERAGGIADDLVRRLQSARIEFVTRPPQNRELSQHEGEMLLNAACLVDKDELDRLRGLVAEFLSRHEAARIEITGPWPPYNFVVGGDAATLA